MCGAEFVVKFSLELNYMDEVCFVMDSKPATLGLLDMIVSVRQEMGFKASKQHGKPYHKGRTAKVERYIQTVKRQASALMINVEDKIHETLADNHSLRAWALTHSVFLLNRFHEHSGIRATAYETVFGKKYSGKLIPFGELRPSKKSGMNIWLGGVWVGKESTSDMNIVVTANGRFTTRSVRRCANAWRKDVILSIFAFTMEQKQS